MKVTPKVLHAKPPTAPEPEPGTAARPAPALGIYLHFPWCLSKCRYCDFASVPVGSDPGAVCHDRYAAQILAELDARMPSLSRHRLTTIFLGGGTPSLWAPEAIARVMTGILERFGKAADEVELTVECNPSSFDERAATGLKLAGVNRISLGVQSLDDNLLHFLGRRHDRAQALSALDLAVNSGFRSVSCDLLFGLPQQSLAGELAQIEEIAHRPVSHLSVYALTIEENTPFGRLRAQGKLPLAPDERVADTFLAIHEALVSRGFRHYEISNYGKPGSECLHNQQYWRGDCYLGLGAAAYGAIKLADDWIRYKNPANVAKYLSYDFRAGTAQPFVLAPDGALEELEILTPEMRMTERILLGLRTAEGILLDALEAELRIPVLTPERLRRIDQQVARGNLLREGHHIRIAPEAWLLADSTILAVA